MSRLVTKPESSAGSNGSSSPEKKKTEQVVISKPNLITIILPIIGTSPYVQCAFPEKAKRMMMEKMQLGDKAAKGKRAQRGARDFDADFRGSLHVGSNGEYGIPASAFRQAAISACRLVNFKMTLAKLSVFVVADFYDDNGTPLVKLDGKPARHDAPGRNANGGVDIRIRAMFKEWKAKVKVRFDADQFAVADVVNLFCRIGEQIGIGEGRFDSRESAGIGWGCFRVDLDAKLPVV